MQFVLQVFSEATEDVSALTEEHAFRQHEQLRSHPSLLAGPNTRLPFSATFLIVRLLSV